MELGLSSQRFWGLTWWEWHLLVYKYYRDRQREEEQLEVAKFLVGRLCATIGNFAGKTMKGDTLTELDFFRFKDERVPDKVDLQELMRRPEIEYRFKPKKNG